MDDRKKAKAAKSASAELNRVDNDIALLQANKEALNVYRLNKDTGESRVFPNVANIGYQKRNSKNGAAKDTLAERGFEVISPGEYRRLVERAIEAKKAPKAKRPESNQQAGSTQGNKQ
jgi:hypothetical protein